MKQSTKLLSLVLALVMAFGCMSVIGNAALVKTEVKWDIIDDADLTPEQVADLALDLVDHDLLAGLETIDLSVLGKLRLNSIDNIFKDVTDLRDSFAWTIGSGLLGDIGKLDFDPLLQSGSYGLLSSHTAYQRSHGDLNVIGALLELIGNDKNSGIISKIGYGLGTSNGISLGLVGNFLDLGDIGDLLGDLPLLLKSLVYDLLIHGSYGYPDNFEERGNTLPAEMDTLDEMVNNALLNLLINPQDYTYEGEGEAAEKVWDEHSIISPSVKAEVEANGRDAMIAKISPLTNSFFTILDNIAQYAINDFGITALNNNLKKTLMEAVEVDFNEIPLSSVPAAVQDEFEVNLPEYEKSYVNYIAYDKIAKDGSNWYYTTMKSETIVDGSGDPVLDEDGNEQTERVRKYFKANMASANDFAALINWDWQFFAPGSDDPDANELNTLDYAAMVGEYGSFIGCLNHLLYLVFKNALTEETQNDFIDVTGDDFLDGTNEDCINDNVVRVTKYVLANFGDNVFGEDSAYANFKYEDIKDYTILDLVALIGPSFFEDAMPQLIMPKNADGTYAFHEGVQVYEFGALVIREFITDIAPNINYDAYIFANGDVTSAADRQFNTANTAEDWFNIILNMGTDIGATYLNQITNFSQFCKEIFGTNFDLEAWVTKGGGKDPEHWGAILDTAILWGVDYVGGQKSTSVLNKFDYNTVSAIKGDGSYASSSLAKLSYVLNTLLPLGFVNGCSSDAYAVDAELLVDRINLLLTEFDLNAILGLFGRNDSAHKNILDDGSLVSNVLGLVNSILNLVFRADILQNTGANSLDPVVSQAALQATVKALLNNLYKNKDAILLNALPVVGKLIKGWGTEQAFNPPQVSLSRAISLTNGATAEAQTVTIRNASDGVWRHYRDASGKEYTDAQYQIQCTSVAAYNFDGKASSYVTTSELNTNKIDYGQSASFKYTAANVPTSGALVRFDIKYKVVDEDGQYMAGGKEFLIRSYAWLNYNAGDAGQETYFNNDGSLSYSAIYSPHYVPLSSATDYIAQITTGKFGRDYKLFTSSQEAAITASTATVDGITFGNVSMKFSNSSGGRYFNDLKQFQTYTVQATNDKGEEQSGSGNALTISGSVNKSAWEATNKTSGSKTTWSITLKAKGKNNGPHNFTLYYYDDIYQAKLASLAANEMSAMRLDADYNLTGTVYANGILKSADSVDENGEKVIRETAYSTLVWIDEDENVYAESQVTDIVETKDDNGVVTAASGTVKVGDKDVAVKKVTAIDCATAVAAYKAAFIPGIRGGMQEWNANSVYNFETLYEALYVAANDMGWCRKTTEQVVAEGNGDNVDSIIETLKSTLDTVESTYTDNYNYTDYKMYILNRLNDARDDAAYYINLKNDASNNSVTEIDEDFPYTWINEDDLRALVKGDGYADIILALLEMKSDEDIESTAQWLEDRKLEYAQVTVLDIEMAQNYLTRVSGRLLNRDHGIIDKYLRDEIASANAMVGAQSQYTARSWAKYASALARANDVLNGANGEVRSQKNIFEAKYNLMVARNELVKVGFEADYTELEALIAQANQALTNMNLYNNTAKEFGQVLAELGYHTFVDANESEIQLFPGNAIDVLAEGYSVDDQDRVDDAATALKEALARLKFKNVAVKGNGVTVGTGTLVEGDEEEGIEAITATIAKIAPELDASAVKALFTVTADNATVGADNITVSNDIHYTVDTDLEGFAGTNATVTFYTIVGGVKVPVQTVKLVVNGDINGDGAVDVLDGAYAELVNLEKGELEGCYLLAGDLVGNDRVVGADDFGAIVNLIGTKVVA